MHQSMGFDAMETCFIEQCIHQLSMKDNFSLDKKEAFRDVTKAKKKMERQDFISSTQIEKKLLVLVVSGM